MSIEINTFFSGMAGSVYAATGLQRVFSSFLYTSIILAIIVLLIVIFIIPSKKNTPAWVIFKALVYIFIANVTVFAMHSSMIRSECKEKYLETNVDKFMNNISAKGGSDVAYAGDRIKIQPNFHGEEYEQEYSQSIDHGHSDREQYMGGQSASGQSASGQSASGQSAMQSRQSELNTAEEILDDVERKI